MAAGNLGLARLALAEWTGDRATARTALAQTKQAAAALREGGHVPGAATFERQIPRAEALVARLEAGDGTG